MNEFIERYKAGIKKLPKSFLELIFPDDGVCAVCGGDGGFVCNNCFSQMERHSGFFCEKCGRTVEKEGLCSECEKHERPYDKGAIAFFYQGNAQKAMREFKFENKLRYSDFFAEGIYEVMKDLYWDIDLITPVPIHPLKLIAKGYNPPALIAKKLAKMLGTEYNGGLIKRTRYTKSMSLLKGINRMAHSERNFAVKNGGFENKHILIIDDVSTTGATLHVCAGILKKHGAGKVYVASACGDTSEK